MQAENPHQITVGVCAMDKKIKSRPMREILSRLKSVAILEFIIFGEDNIINQPVEQWPIVDCLIAFFSTGFPLDKAISYAKMRKPFLLNDLLVQNQLKDRRRVYQRLVDNGIETPRHSIFNRDKNNVPLEGCDEIEENDDVIVVKNQVFKKPFVEKPIDADDHNIYIYYPSSAGGGCQILFRKVGNKSSVYSTKDTIRRKGSFIYEDFMPTDGTDVKVYTIGDEYAHAEARKAPVLDGKVERDFNGKELRYPIILNTYEKLIAQKVSKAFKQTICGFDLLRANGKSYVCDVNGFSFVKTSKKYYDDCAKLLNDIILKKLAPQMLTTLNFCSSPANEMATYFHANDRYQLRSVVAIMRHGDRTPKQKMKLVVTHKLFFEIFSKYGGEKEGRLKIKKPKQMQEILDVVRVLVDGFENDKSLQPIEENKTKLVQMKNALEMYGTFNGINRKVQLKAMHDERNAGMFTKLKGRNKRVKENQNKKTLLLIVKWGGELTPLGKKQAEELGRAFRCVYSTGKDIYGTSVPGCGLVRLHSSYRHNLKIYASDEGRVQMTAAAFAKGLLELEGELTPILVSLVQSNNYSTGLLDTPPGVEDSMSRVKQNLHEFLQSENEFTEREHKLLSPIEKSAVLQAMKKVGNPKEMCLKVYELIDNLVDQIQEFHGKTEKIPEKMYYDESLNLMDHRWKKLRKDFYDGSEFDISLIPDIYDCVRYDYIHNRPIGLKNLPQLHEYVKPLADIVIPQEYGIKCEEKLEISKKIAGRFFKKLQSDLKSNINNSQDCNKENEETKNCTESILTRLYITSESHIHSVVNALRCGNVFKSKEDKQWQKALDHLNNNTELNYLTQIVFLEYEDMSADPTSDERFKISLYFSPGVKGPTTPKLANELQELSLGNQSDYVLKPDNDLDDVQLVTVTQEREREADQCMRKRRDMVVIDEENNNIGENMNGYLNLSRKRKISLSRARAMSVEVPTIVRLEPPREDHALNIYEADIIETIPSLHPLVSLHRSINLKQIDEFLDEFKIKECDV